MWVDLGGCAVLWTCCCFGGGGGGGGNSVWDQCTGANYVHQADEFSLVVLLCSSRVLGQTLQHSKEVGFHYQSPRHLRQNPTVNARQIVRWSLR